MMLFKKDVTCFFRLFAHEIYTTPAELEKGEGLV